jgi:hypothetical protein
MSGPSIDLDPPPQPQPDATQPVAAMEPPPAPSGPRPRRPLPTTRQFAVMSVAILLAAVVAFGALILLPERFDEGPGTIVILLVAGLVALTLLLYLGTVIHRTAGVGTSKSALGMPEGSIRALIALSLVLMFAIIGVTVLYAGMGTQEETVSSGITAAQIEDLENVQIIAISVVDPAASPGTETYNVTVRPEISQAGHDFGLQLLTTVSTLVVAVAGFYFGTRAVSQGSKAALAAVATRPTTESPPAGTVTEASPSDTVADEGAGSEVLAETDVIGAVEDAAAEDDVTDETVAQATGAEAAADADADDDRP